MRVCVCNNYNEIYIVHFPTNTHTDASSEHFTGVQGEQQTVTGVESGQHKHRHQLVGGNNREETNNVEDRRQFKQNGLVDKS